MFPKGLPKLSLRSPFLVVHVKSLKGEVRESLGRPFFGTFPVFKGLSDNKGGVAKIRAFKFFCSGPKFSYGATKFSYGAAIVHKGTLGSGPVVPSMLNFR